ncbi:tellurite resistance/C4-dicarboxylate transporter family protein [Streptomyces sp. GbtcB7]|uniref:tellurite resistance/C4-dicarboxylate transporter family protein n=1 Tax=Streptomyces sp. GbtcB7 TaxID=2824752 RepID=UPI001C2F6D7F|nr:tellurite resistance/C4-dicarboxylate transporter family protein [Streptomyces sp. GbtcB7]
MSAISPPGTRWTGLRTWWAQSPPGAGAAILATGIISIGLEQTGYEILSRIVLALAAVGWLGLAAAFVVRLLRERERWLTEAGTPSALTAVAATTVLGTRLVTLGWEVSAEALLALSAALWPGLLLLVVRQWRPRMPGAVFLGCVATQGLAVLGATLAAATHTDWLAHTALVLFWLGLVLYAAALFYFDYREVATGAGDQWVAGGALAISALAGSKLILAYQANIYLWNNDDNGVLRWVTEALLVLVLGSYCVLAVAEALWPRPRYDVLRWATVFPLGMTAVAALSVAAAIGVGWLRGLGQVLLWISVAAWLAVAAVAVRRPREP